MPEVYLVGGAVRDALLASLNPQAPAQPSDRDWVVVGSTPDAMLAQGFAPVGQDFPVFLHPVSREEYALARTERKSGQGYRGFECIADPNVTLSQDLSRRDLTINAMAVAQDQVHALISWQASQGSPPVLIDPYNGWADLQAGVLRHVSDAFVEDPVRILRLARFAARWPHFRVAPSTQHLLKTMVEAGEVDHLVPERVWQELSKGLMSPQPSRMLQVLRDCGALAVLLPEVDRLYGVPQRAEYHPEVDTGVHVEMVLDMAAQMNAPLSVLFACLCHDLGKGTTPTHLWPRHLGHEARSATLLQALAQRWRVPKEFRELADVVAREHGHVHASMGLGAAALVRLLGRCDAFRRPERFAEVLQACEADARGRLGFEQTPYPQAQRLQTALDAALTVQAREVMRTAQAQGRTLEGPAVAQAMTQAREQAVAQALRLPTP